MLQFKLTNSGFGTWFMQLSVDTVPVLSVTGKLDVCIGAIEKTLAGLELYESSLVELEVAGR